MIPWHAPASCVPALCTWTRSCSLFATCTTRFSYFVILCMKRFDVTGPPRKVARWPRRPSPVTNFHELPDGRSVLTPCDKQAQVRRVETKFRAQAFSLAGGAWGQRVKRVPERMAVLTHNPFPCLPRTWMTQDTTLVQVQPYMHLVKAAANRGESHGVPLLLRTGDLPWLRMSGDLPCLVSSGKAPSIPVAALAPKDNEKQGPAW